MSSRRGSMATRMPMALCLLWIGIAVRKENSFESEDLETDLETDLATVEHETTLVNKSTGRHCDPSKVNRRREVHADMCKCRRRRNTFELAHGWHCNGHGGENRDRIVETGGSPAHGGGGHHPVITSDCKTRLNVNYRNNAACIITNNSKALLVYVYYDKPGGRHRGWDLPGGELKGHSEVACESAEREACEETKMQVRAVQTLSRYVYKCEIVRENSPHCQKQVDEGTLKMKWVSYNELDHIQYRGNTWGDKKKLLKAALANGRDGGNSGGQGGGGNGCQNVMRRRRNQQMCSCRRRQYKNELPPGFKCDMHRNAIVRDDTLGTEFNDEMVSVDGDGDGSGNDDGAGSQSLWQKILSFLKKLFGMS
eukprot:TRINITY_DN3328_c0_g1_i5.p1 TRINITY_DN3328_c0_g1~~TRINITY_DN3328_c0_g1_i5.p1  ORF type:complete len:367 (+),score=41.01 TRINITY_DN3328_c0_g1_i5:77-1177(+)